MSQRINVAVPDELYKRYHAVKDNIDNVSAIFQQALERKIEMLEGLNKSTDNLEKIAIKLKEQKKNHEDQIFKEGKLKGYQEVELMCYEDFLEFEQLAGAQEENYRNGITLDINQFPDNFRDEIIDKDFTGDAKIFLQGFLDGTMEVWRKLKSKI